MICIEDAKKNKRVIDCYKTDYCKKIKSKVPPKLPERYIFAWQAYEKTVSISGYDGMNGMPKIDKMEYALNSFNIVMSAENYERLQNDIIGIHNLMCIEIAIKNKPPDEGVKS